MISIDYYLLKKDYPRGLECIDRFEQAVGGDPYLNIIRRTSIPNRSNTTSPGRMHNVRSRQTPPCKMLTGRS